MAVSATIRAVFDHFQNLNLLALLESLRAGQTARQAWFSGSLLCPVAHGLSDGHLVRELTVLGQAAELDDGCKFAAQKLGADPDAVLWFVRAWDEGTVDRNWLLRQLDQLWQERLEDAEIMQELLQGAPEHGTMATPPGLETAVLV